MDILARNSLIYRFGLDVICGLNGVFFRSDPMVVPRRGHTAFIPYNIRVYLCE